MWKRLTLACALLSGNAWAGIDPGNWEFSVESPLAQNKNGPVVKQRCITPDEAADPEKVLADAADSRCQLANAHDNGSEYTFDLSCTKTRVPVTGKGSVRYKPDSLDGHIDLVGERQGFRIKTRSFVSARRLGPCKE